MFVHFWKSLKPHEKRVLADEVGTKINYLRHVMYGRKKAGYQLAQDLHHVTHGKVSMHKLRPDIYPASFKKSAELCQ